MQNNDKIQFLAVGDIVTEPFIKIKDASVHCKIDHGACELCFRFGDKVPYESATLIRAVGNSANAAVSAARLGIASTMMTYIGDDEIGRGNIEELKRNNVDVSHVVVAPGYESNFHYVLWYDVERTILVKHTEFPYSFPMDLPAPEWMYLSSLATNSAEYHIQIAKYLESNKSVKLAFQPGTFQMKLDMKTLDVIYRHTEIFFCNVEEAQRILKVETREVKELINGIRDLGPRKVVVTDGIDGAYAYDGEKYWFMPVYPHDPVERTGAGDAFASTLTSFLVLGKSFDEALIYAPINAMSVTQKVGAQAGLLTREALEEYLKNAPADYKIKEI